MEQNKTDHPDETPKADQPADDAVGPVRHGSPAPGLMQKRQTGNEERETMSLALGRSAHDRLP